MLDPFKYFVISMNTETYLPIFDVNSQSSSFSLQDNPPLIILFNMIQDFLKKVEVGLTATDIENFIFFVIAIRVIILYWRYNLITSFYINCVCAAAAYLWYRHLFDLLGMYKSILIHVPQIGNLATFSKLGWEMYGLEELYTKIYLNEASDAARWHTPIQLFEEAAGRVLIHNGHYIDPLSIIISKFNLSPFFSNAYYFIYEQILGRGYQTTRKFIRDISKLVIYSLIVRSGKKRCPYLIRWHWTTIIVTGVPERFYVGIVCRFLYYQQDVIRPLLYNSDNFTLQLQSQVSDLLLYLMVFIHLSFVCFGLVHALCGQYFYIPLITENTELHIGPRLAQENPVFGYRGGDTAWQENKTWSDQVTNSNTLKFWYGWFGRGTDKPPFLIPSIAVLPIPLRYKKLLRKFVKSLKRLFKR